LLLLQPYFNFKFNQFGCEPSLADYHNRRSSGVNTEIISDEKRLVGREPRSRGRLELPEVNHFHYLVAHGDAIEFLPVQKSDDGRFQINARHRCAKGLPRQGREELR